MTITIPGETHQDDDGNWVTSDPTTRTEKCRAEPNNSGRYIVGADGQQIYYSWIVYMPKGVAKIPDGTQVSITWDGVSLGQGKSSRFSPGQLNSRLWL